jgi:cytochrome c oxidase accessory protein FixG
MQKDQKGKKPSNQFDLPKERLASTSKTGSRVYIYPARIIGFFRTTRTLSYSILMIIFLTLPWIKINGQQVLLLNIAERKFNIFGLHFWGHDAPILVLVLLIFVFSLGLITALFGRVWCGWACPQTVFIDLFYRRIEEFIEGSPRQRRRLNEGTWTKKRISKKLILWSLYIVISLIITHSFLAYFVGSEQMMEMIKLSPKEHPTSFLTIIISTAIILFDFAWFREQFCIIACPYGRLQSVLMTKNSLVVGYDKKRGEPRKQDRHDTTSKGDCINCYRCVQVCPTGVDIRRGTQMECIMCTACIDACDRVMEKIGKPTGLVRYDSEMGLDGKKMPLFRPRVILYFLLIIFSMTALKAIVSHRDLIPVHVTRDRHHPYTELQDDKLLNHFRVSIRNQYLESIKVELALVESSENSGMTLTTPSRIVRIDGGSSFIQDVFIQFNNSALDDGKKTITLTQIITLPGGKLKFIEREVVLLGPKY